jgi:type VI secretion system secreted protein VgrG
VRPSNSQMMAYDYLNSEVYNSSPQSVESKAGLNDMGKHVLQASNTVYSTQPKVWNNQFFSNKKQLDDIHNIRLAMQSSNNVRFTGTSDHPGVKVGGSITVQGRNLLNMSSENYGDYTILSVNHYFDGQGNYNNDFTAIPSTIKVPPVTTVIPPAIETQSAVVTDNHDPKGLGRVRVKFHWMNGPEKSPWIRVASPHGGGGKGMHFSPELGEEVIVGFEGDSPTKGYVVGTVYNGKAANTFSSSGNDVKALQTRSGNKVVMNDADGSVFVEDKDGNSMMIDGAGNITLKSNKTVTIDAVNEITLKTKKISMLAENEIYMEAKNEQIKLESKKLDGQFSQTAEIFGKTEMKIHSQGESIVNGKNKVSVGAEGEVKVLGQQTVNVDSRLINITGEADVVVKAAGIKLNC